MKNLKKLIFISTALLLPVFNGFGQFVPGASGYNEVALMLSHTQIGGSARMLGIGGAQISLGGDVSTIGSNPAGLGLFNRSEFSISPAFNFINVDAGYYNEFSAISDSKFNFGNIGVVFNNSKDDIVPGEWRGGSFGISINKVNDFNNNIYYQGFNDQNSILDYFAQAAEGIPYEAFFDGPIDLLSQSFLTYLINPESAFDPEGSDSRYLPIIFNDQFPQQEEEIITSGGQYQWSFGYGGNFADKVYFGANLGLTTLNYESDKLYTEIIDPVQDFDPGVDFTIDENTQISGTGINGTFGVIVRPVDIVRVGLSFTTPTIFNIDDERTSDVFTNFFQKGDSEGEFFDDYEFVMLDSTVFINEIDERGDLIVSEYRITTPYRLNAGVSFFLGKNGFISGDVEYIDYSQNKLRSDDFIASEDNRIMDQIYDKAINYRIGGEYRYKIFRIRAGFAHQADPFKEIVAGQADRSVNQFSAGLGIRLPEFYIDLAAVNRQWESQYSPYTLGPDTPVVNLDNNTTSIIASIGFFF
ncbi:MAG: OmpP1/FadL family transporter [Candidatus Cyclobacteriaceae bacterium M3_2C_046]